MELNRETRDTLITSLYERYGRGEISVTQREQLIQKINDKFYTETVALMNEKNTVETKSEDVKESTNEKFEKFKDTLVEKYNNGEITEASFDLLLEKAKEKFLN